MLADTKAFLAIWHDLVPDGKIEWERWHTYEHMPERIGIPGFLGGRRYMNHDDPKQCCFTMYEGNNLSVFKSTPYLKRLNNPTPWTKKSALTFKNFTRGACKCVSTSGQKNGYGGALMTIRLLKGKNFSKNFKYFDQLTSITNELDGIITSTLGICNGETASTETTERKLRKGTPETSLEGVLIIDGYDETILKEQSTKILNIINSSSIDLKSQQIQTYTLSYILRE